MPTRSSTTAGTRSASPHRHSGEAVTPRAESSDPTPALQFEEARELTLLRAWREGNAAALEELLLAVEPRLMSLCFRMCGRPQDARDLCQEAMVKIIQGLPGFTGRSRISTWMIRVAMNVCLTDRRRSKIRRMSSLDAPAGPKSPEDSQSLADSRSNEREPSPAARVEHGEDLGRLSRGLARIEPEQRALLILRDAQGLDYAEIADVMGIPVGTVKSRLFRARVALREEVEKP